MPVNPIDWYDLIAGAYDAATVRDRFYRTPRRAAIERLVPGSGDVVLDVFCGPGVNFEPLGERIGAAGRIVGIDGSAGMLEQADRLAARLEREPFEGGGPAIGLRRADLATDAGIRAVEHAIEEYRPRRFLFTLGLTCLANHRDLTRRMYAAAPPGSTFSLMDIHSDRPTLGALYLNWIGAADCSRPVWEGLEERADGFGLETFRPFEVFGARVLDVSVIVAWGRKG